MGELVILVYFILLRVSGKIYLEHLRLLNQLLLLYQ